MTTNLTPIWESIADRLGDRPALVHGERVVSWSDFEQRAARLAAAFAAMGIEGGSVIAIDLYNCPEFFEVFFGAIKGAYIPTMVNYRYRANELAHLLADSGAQLVVADPQLVDGIRAINDRLPDLRHVVELGQQYEALITDHGPADRRSYDDDGAMLSYTGGTTGLPKGVVYDMPRLVGQTMRTRPMVVAAPGDFESSPVDLAVDLDARGLLPVCCPASPLMHSTAFTFVSLPTLNAGGSVVTLENRHFDADLLVDAFERHRVTATGIVGDAFGRPLVAALDERAASGRPFPAEDLRVVCSAGVAFSADTKRRLLEHVPRLTIVDACGSTEGATFGMAVARAGDDVSTARFQPAPGTIIVDQDRNPLPHGEVGLISGITVTGGYYKQPGKTAETFYERDGEWRVIPGDYGRIEPDGSITLLGRGSTVINTGGEKVHPEEVEDVIKSIPGIVDVVVGPVPDERLGSVVGALVQRASNADVDSDAVTAHVRQQLAGYKAPRHVVFVDTIPRGPNGKQDVARVKALLQAT